jgi:hypothetical protein
MILTDTVVSGETYGLAISCTDPDGVAIILSAGWTAACTVCAGKIGGVPVTTIPLTVAGGIATGSLDTDAILVVGRYYMDVRITDDLGNNYWTAPWCLHLVNHNTPPA